MFDALIVDDDVIRFVHCGDDADDLVVGLDVDQCIDDVICTVRDVDVRVVDLDDVVDDDVDVDDDQ